MSIASESAACVFLSLGAGAGAGEGQGGACYYDKGDYFIYKQQKGFLILRKNYKFSKIIVFILIWKIGHTNILSKKENTVIESIR